MSKLLFAAVTLLASVAAYAAPKAVIEIEPENWYYRKMALGSVKEGLSLTRGYAPFPVFFEGWKSEPAEDSTEYEWDFGDGAKMPGFCAAHVFEKPGKYTVTLKVTDGAGQSNTAKTEIEVLKPDGQTYYVDAERGNDESDGLSAEKPWKTATHAFMGMGQRRYGAGDRILFKRGQTFDMEPGKVAPGHGTYRHGYSFGAYGEGERPVIRHTPAAEGTLIKFNGNDACHIGFEDLVFDGTGSDGRRDTVFACIARCTDILFLRCGFRGGHQHVGFNGPSEDKKGQISGAFIFNCDGKGSGDISIYLKAKRVGVVGNTWEDSGDHIIYGGAPSIAVFHKNTFRRPSFGKTALRISAGSGSFEQPTEHVVVSDNVFEGWIDPKKRQGSNGKRWNYTLCTISPNRPSPQLIRHVRWERNTVTGFETALQIGACEDVLIRDNRFEAQGGIGASPRFKIGSEFEKRPIRGVRFVNNTIISDEARSAKGQTGAIFALYAYRGGGEGRHTDLVFRDNKVILRNGLATIWWFEGATPDNHPGMTVKGTYEGVDPAKDLVVKYGGDFKNAGRQLTLEEWHAQAESGKKE